MNESWTKESLSKWMVKNGYATENADTVEDLLGNLSRQVGLLRCFDNSGSRWAKKSTATRSGPARRTELGEVVWQLFF